MAGVALCGSGLTYASCGNQSGELMRNSHRGPRRSRENRTLSTTREPGPVESAPYIEINGGI
jgi:hypothetical protein